MTKRFVARQPGARRRAIAVPMLVVFVVTACSSGPSDPTVPQVPGATMPAPGEPGASQPDGSSPPGSSGSGGTMAPLPADIVAAVDRFMDATSDDERTEAATAMLTSAGITVSGEEDAAPDGHAELVLAPEEIEMMAREAADRRLHRATLADFAMAFGGMAFLPPNDAVAADLPENWVDVPPPEGEVGSEIRVDLQMTELPSRLAATTSTWVTGAIEGHESSDPNLVGLTVAPLLLAELARRRAEPIDLARPFAAGDLRLSWLEITLLTAGMRSMLVGVEATGIAAGDADAVLAVRPGEAPVGPAPPAQATACDTLHELLATRAPLTATRIQGWVGDQIRGFIQNFVNALFGEASALAQNVGRAFKVLSVLFKVQALIMLYTQATARVEMDPTSYHKPDGQPMSVTATVIAGIPDAAWEAAQQARQATPFATALHVCARHLGLPVMQDLVDVAGAMDGWQVGWSIRQGAEHVRFGEGEFLGPGAVASRQERPMGPVNDHTANDILTYDVLPEPRENHPGTEFQAPVELCAQVYPKAPPNGFSTILSAGTAGASLAGGAYLGLIAVIANLLTSWVSTVHALQACGQATVGYHVPTPGTWSGTLTVNTELQQSSSATTALFRGPPIGVTRGAFSMRTSIDVTDRFYFGSTEDFPGGVNLEGRQYTHGMAVDEIESTTSNGANSSCFYDVHEVGYSAGAWSFEADVRGSISIASDGRYTIHFSGRGTDEEVVLPGDFTSEYSNIRPASCNNPSEGYERPYYPQLTSASLSVSSVEGQLDPENPGNVLQGRQEITNFDLSVTTITWNLVHDGPIRLPGS